MAGRGNMIVTLVAQTKKFQDGLRDAGKKAQTFGSVMGSAMNVALGALGLLAGAVFMFLPNFIKMGEEARKSELRLGNVAKQMGLFGDETDKVTGRISKYAEELSYLTGIDDELTRENQAVLLTFSELAKSADKVGGPFDRATAALLDLEAAGKDLKAVALGKALQDPLENMTALRKAGILLTDEQEKQIESFMKANDVISAQDVLLKAIEDQVGGTAEATASATDKMNAKFESVGEELSLALLPAVDAAADALTDWLDSTAGQKAIDDLKIAIQDFSDWINSPEGAKTFEDFATTMGFLAGSIKYTVEMFTNFLKTLQGISDWFSSEAGQRFLINMSNSAGNTGGVYIDPGNTFLDVGPQSRRQNPTVADRVNITINGVVSGPATSRTVLDAVKEANRLGQR